jgi:hypothetical protein
MAPRRYPDCVARDGKPRMRALEDVIALPLRSPVADELRRALAAASSLHGFRSDLARVPVRTTATTSEAGAYRFRKREPIDIRVSARSGRLPLGFLHEVGHFVDHQLGYDSRNRVWASAIHPAFAAWRSAAAAVGVRPFPGGRSRQRYFESAHEVWARSYAQTALLHSGDAALLEALAALQRKDDPFVWPARAFAPVALEVERVFERLGLTQLTLPLAA